VEATNSGAEVEVRQFHSALLNLVHF
jgi:hypothetical protein